MLSKVHTLPGELSLWPNFYSVLVLSEKVRKNEVHFGIATKIESLSKAGKSFSIMCAHCEYTDFLNCTG